MNNDTRPTYIYVLKCPLSGEVRYVGKTVMPLKTRLSQHLRDKSNSHKALWIRSLIEQELQPVIEAIETVLSDSNWVERECYWIKYYRTLNANLTNGTDGGEGVTVRLSLLDRIEASGDEDLMRSVGEMLFGDNPQPIQAIQQSPKTYEVSYPSWIEGYDTIVLSVKMPKHKNKKGS